MHQVVTLVKEEESEEDDTSTRMMTMSTTSTMQIEEPQQQQQQQQQQLRHQQQHQKKFFEGERENFVATSGGKLNEMNQTTGTHVNRCAGCREHIRDKFIFAVIGLYWHQDCVRCSVCSTKLSERCYTFDGKLYCRVDYWRRFGPKCFACSETMDRSELVQRIKENRVYHLKCFTCNDCHKQLKAGEQLHLIDGKKLLCEQDYHNHQQLTASSKSLSSSNNNSTILEQNNNKSKLSSLAASSNNSKSSSLVLSDQQHSAAVGAYDHYTLMSGSHQSRTDKLLAANLDIKLESSKGKLNVGGASEEGVEEGIEQDELDDEEEEEDEGQYVAGDGVGHSSSAGRAQHQSSGHNKSAGDGLLKNSSSSSSTGNLGDCSDDLVDANGKRRGPRTTIKPKQLETLRRAFETASKPTRHIREQLAAETGLNMRVIQVWFQNRRSKERRMKKPNGCVRRNFFRSSSRRLQSGPTSNTASSNGSNSGIVTSQQSLIAGSRGGAKSAREMATAIGQQQSSPGIDSSTASENQLKLTGSSQQQANSARQTLTSPSDFGTSLTGGFTYFSDSSNQGDAFAINTSGQQTPQQTSNQAPNNPQQPQYLTSAGAGPQDQANLMALESPSGVDGTNQQNVQQQQYGHQSIKNTPPPPHPPMYSGGAPPPPASSHMLMAGCHGPLQASNSNNGPPPQVAPSMVVGHTQHSHPHPGHQLSGSQLGSQMLQPNPGMGGLNGLLTHPHGPSVVQW